MFIEAMNSGGSGGEKIIVDTWNISRGGNQSKEIDCTSVPNYQNLTANDFYLDISGATFQIAAFLAGTGSWATEDIAFAKTYDPTTGKLTVSLTKTGSGSMDTPAGVIKIITYGSSGGGGSRGITIPSLTAAGSTGGSQYARSLVSLDASDYSTITIGRIYITSRNGNDMVVWLKGDGTNIATWNTDGTRTNLSYDISAYATIELVTNVAQYSEGSCDLSNIQIT